MVLVTCFDVYADSKSSSNPERREYSRDTPRGLVEYIFYEWFSINSGDITLEEFKKRIKCVLLLVFSVESIAKFVLGRHAKQITKEEFEGFVDAFANMMISFYASKLFEYRNARFKIVSVTERSKTHAIVRVAINKKDGDETPLMIDLSIFTKDGACKVFDAIIDGVSLSKAQQAGISGSIKKKGMSKFMRGFRKEHGSSETKKKD
jgi:ABC-type transporter MlaC component